MRRLLLPTIAITGLTFLGQLASLALQMLMASMFGASRSMDAYVAAQALPNFTSTVLIGAVSFVFIPIFVSQRTRSTEAEAWSTAGSIVGLYVVVMTAVAAAGAIFARPLLLRLVPGLPAETLGRAIALSAYTWPTVALSGLVLLLVALYHAYERFIWPAIVPVIGALLTLALAAGLAPRFGIEGLVWAAMASNILQLALLYPIVHRRMPIHIRLRDPQVRETLVLIAPLVIGAAVSQASKLIDRWVASGLASGSVAHLSYAEKICTLIAVVLSGGIAVTVFPSLARASASTDHAALRATVAYALRATWVIVAPAVALCVTLATPLIATMLQRGAFESHDSVAVAGALRWYAFALIGMSMGNITARVFYALRDTKTLSILGVPELVLYAVYAPWIGRAFGLSGIGMAAMLFWNLSIGAHFVLLWLRLGRPRVFSFSRVMFLISAAALSAGIVASIVAALVQGPPILRLAFAGTAGLVTYAVGLHVLQVDEARMLLGITQRWFAQIRERTT